MPYKNVPHAVKGIGSAADGKVLVDVTNAVGESNTLSTGCSTSAAVELQKLAPKARVLKAFNTVFAQDQSRGQFGDEISLFS